MSKTLIRRRPVATGLHGQPAWEQRFMALGLSLWPPLNSTTARFAFGAPGRMIYLCAASRRLPRAVNGVSGGRLGHPNNKSRAGDPRNGSPSDVFGRLGWSLGRAKAAVLRAL